MSKIIIESHNDGTSFVISWLDEKKYPGRPVYVETIKNLSDIFSYLDDPEQLYKLMLWICHGDNDYGYYDDPTDWEVYTDQRVEDELFGIHEEPFTEPHRKPKHKEPRFIKGKIQF